ncbi:restriction endonuclease [Clostridium sp. M62/1]|uniref:restriction endonuclease n=1 Tax=Clostridium sp. M62/1 TaxID=411486 RepID=UPI0035650010
MERDFISIFILALGTAGSIYIAKSIFDSVIKRNFSKSYGTGKLPRSIEVRKKSNEKGNNYYYLNYPYWSVSKKDGTADRRVKKNAIIWEKSNLYVDNYLVFSKRPYDLVEVVRRLRSQGVKIDLCKEEKKKRAELLKKKEAFAHNNDIQKIIDYYSEKPTNFEGLCSELFESLGYVAKQTPPTNDGGYDILLSKGAEKTIVECKCYSIEHRVGRPSIQKLVGANNIVLANKMLFITTSDFSVAAISYAEEVGVELINGNKLMELLDKQGFIEKEKVKINVMECQLEIADLYPYVPRDIYERFFE